MATGNFVLDKGFNAGAALTKFRAVKADPDNAESVIPVTAFDDVIVGFAQFTVTADEIDQGKGASVRMLGITEAEAAGAIAFGEQVQLESNGTVTKAVNSSGKRVVGKCTGHPSTTSGDRISLFIDPVGDLAAGVTS